MSRWTIARRLIAGFSAVILVTLLLGGFAFSRLLTIDYDARRIVGDALPGVTAILQMSVNTRENRALMLEHLVAETPAAKAAIESAIAERAEANNKTAKAYEATITLDEDRVLFARMAPVTSPTAPARVGAPKGRVVAMPAPARPMMARPTNEERIPLGDTGTFGSF